MNNATSRRGFLGISGAALAARQIGAFQRAPSGGRLFAFVGRHTSGFFGTGKGGGITVFRVDVSEASLREVRKTGRKLDYHKSDGMCTSAEGRFLYSIFLPPA